MDFLWPNVANRSALLVAEDHVEDDLLRSRAHGWRGGLTRSVLLGLLLGRNAECTHQKYGEKNRQPVHGRDLQRKRLRCKCSATCNTSKNDFFQCGRRFGKLGAFVLRMRPQLRSANF